MLQAAVAMSAGKTVAAAGSGIVHLFDSYDHEADTRRQATNARAANLAQQGVADAWRYLGMRGDVIPAGTVGPLALNGEIVTPGGYIDGWASPPAREDAASKYRALAPKFSGLALANPSGNRGDVGGIDPVTGQPLGGPATAGLGSNSGAMLVLAAIVLVIVFTNGKG